MIKFHKYVKNDESIGDLSIVDVAINFAYMKFYFIGLKLEKFILWDILQCQNIYLCACYIKSNRCIVDLISLRSEIHPND